jgi:flagellar biosynthesis/type III secretory pathway protein FliH
MAKKIPNTPVVVETSHQSRLEKFISSFDPPLPKVIAEKLIQQEKAISELQASKERFDEQLEQTSEGAYEKARTDIMREHGLDNTHVSTFLASYAAQQREIKNRFESLERAVRQAVKKPYEYGDDD